MTTLDCDDTAEPMTDEELDHLLDSASATLSKRVKSSTNVNILLTNLLDVRPEKLTPELTPFMVHVRLRQIIADLYRATILTNCLAKIIPTSEQLGSVSKAVSAAFDKASSDDLDEVADLVRLLNVATARALAAAMSPIATNDLLLEAYLSTLIGALISTLGRGLARASDLAIDLPRISEDAYESTARDLCGADLSNHDFGSIQILYDFVWDDQTKWPAALASQAKKNSVPTGEGTYRIRSITPLCNINSAAVVC
ncbi:hypothetical protein [Nonomuraea jiangxiensis]|uniref:Uncharacterized protein n=1 Tax=Nonomuraea jiangxiensis TaxID=633440 RepID=A0A1G9KWC9_9ACTN|nr:hypothetical protein [Nonomuraea jiangxiensis]SDL54180.1 hypothetical protein SAMN05421869_12718 [Nonomuraea jiangxiensis]